VDDDYKQVPPTPLEKGPARSARTSGDRWRATHNVGSPRRTLQSSFPPGSCADTVSIAAAPTLAVPAPAELIDEVATVTGVHSRPHHRPELCPTPPRSLSYFKWPGQAFPKLVEQVGRLPRRVKLRLPRIRDSGLDY
jgi:hypothetical protein